MTTAHGICKHCHREAVHLARGGVYEVIGDEDDDLDGRSIYADRDIEVEIHIGTHICFECGTLEDFWFEEPRDGNIEHIEELTARVAELETALRQASLVISLLADRESDGVCRPNRADYCDQHLARMCPGESYCADMAGRLWLAALGQTAENEVT